MRTFSLELFCLYCILILVCLQCVMEKALFLSFFWRFPSIAYLVAGSLEKEIVLEKDWKLSLILHPMIVGSLILKVSLAIKYESKMFVLYSSCPGSSRSYPILVFSVLLIILVTQ